MESGDEAESVLLLTGNSTVGVGVSNMGSNVVMVSGMHELTQVSVGRRKRSKRSSKTPPGSSLQPELRSHQDSNLISMSFLSTCSTRLPWTVGEAFGDPAMLTAWG